MNLAAGPFATYFFGSQVVNSEFNDVGMKNTRRIINLGEGFRIDNGIIFQ